MTSHTELPALDAFDEGFHQCPFPQLSQLRAQAPVHALTEPGWYIVTSMELVREVLTDPDRFSNKVSRRTPPPPEVAEQVAAIRAQGLPSVPTLLMNDPPVHTRYRRLVQRALTPRALAFMEPLIAEVATELAISLPDGGQVDFVEAFSRPLPVWAISRVLGLSDDRRADVRRWTEAATATIGAHPPAEKWIEVEHEMLDFQMSISAELERRRTEPQDDLLTLLVQANDDSTEDGPEIGIPELVSLTRELMVAGNESSLRLLADVVFHLDRHPEEWARVRADPDRADQIVEEAVRLASPSASVFRRVARHTSLGGVDLPVGSTLVVSLLSANRDEAVFPDGDAFDPDRPAAQRHVSFGQGIHACIGNVLARTEARHAVRALAEHVERIDVVAHEPLRYLPSLIVRGLVEVPVQVTRRAAAPATIEDSTEHVIQLTVTERTLVADGVVSLVLSSPSVELPRWEPGAHVDLLLSPTLTRQYSLTGSPADRSRYRIGVLLDEGGRGGSRMVHDELAVGRTVAVRGPRNNFPLVTAQRYVFIAGGIGITPLVPMVEAATAAGAAWTLHYGGRRRSSMALLDELAVYGDRVRVLPEDDSGGMLDLDAILGQPQEDTLVYVCGPEGLLSAVEARCASWPRGSLHVERFAPRPQAPFVRAGDIEVVCERSAVTVTVPPGRTIMEVLEENGLNQPSSCLEGVCGTCETRVIDGVPDHHDSILTAEEREAGEYMMICVSRAKTARLVLDL